MTFAEDSVSESLQALSKTKDVVVDLRNQTSISERAIIKDQTIDCVHIYKYLGTVINSELTFGKNSVGIVTVLDSR